VFTTIYSLAKHVSNATTNTLILNHI